MFQTPQRFYYACRISSTKTAIPLPFQSFHSGFETINLLQLGSYFLSFVHHFFYHNIIHTKVTGLSFKFHTFIFLLHQYIQTDEISLYVRSLCPDLVFPEQCQQCVYVCLSLYMRVAEREREIDCVLCIVLKLWY